MRGLAFDPEEEGQYAEADDKKNVSLGMYPANTRTLIPSNIDEH